MNPFSGMFSTILGNLGGMTSGQQPTSIISQLAQPSGAGVKTNPFGDALSMASGLIGGPMSKQGTVSSLPGELLRGVEGIITGDDIIGDTLNLAKPIENLGLKGLGDISSLLGGLNPFGSGGDGRLGGIIPLHYLPFLAMGAAGAASDVRKEEKRREELAKRRR